MIKNLYLIILIIALAGAMSCHRTARETASQKDSLNIEKLSSMIRNDPKNAENFFRRGKLYYEMRQSADAVKDLEIAIKLDSLVPEYYLTLSEYFLSMGKSGSTKQYLEKCVRLFPENTEALIKLADIYLYIKDYKTSMDYLIIAQEIDKQIAQIYFTKAMIYKETGDTSRAIDNLLTSVEKQPDYYDAYIELGHLNLLRNDSIAVEFLKNAIRIMPQSAEAYYFTGIYYQQNSQFRKAIEYFDQIINEIDKSYPYAYYNIGYINLVYFKQYDTAIDYFSKAIENKTNYYQAFCNRGYAYEMLKQYDMASANYKQSLELLPNYDLAIAGLNRLDNKRTR